ncbi:hypothetical protein M9458_040426, partial [Cirrhinus mrigala]
TKDNGNRSEHQNVTETDGIDFSSEKEEVDLDLNVDHQGDNYDKTSAACQTDQDVTDGQADTLSKSLSEVSASVSANRLDKQLENPSLSTVDDKEPVFREGSSDNDKEFVSKSNKDMSKNRLDQDILANETVGTESGISNDKLFGVVENEKEKDHIEETSSSKETLTIFREDTEEEALNNKVCQDVLTDAQSIILYQKEMESKPFNSFLDKLTIFFTQNKGVQKQDGFDDKGDAFDIIKTLQTNAEEDKTKDHVNRSEQHNVTETNEADFSIEKKKVDLDLNVDHEGDKYDETSAARQTDQDVADGQADMPSKSLSDVSASDSANKLDKQLENPALTTVDDKEPVFREGSSDNDEELVLKSNDKDMSKNRLNQDISSNETVVMENEREDDHREEKSSRKETLTVFRENAEGQPLKVFQGSLIDTESTSIPSDRNNLTEFLITESLDSSTSNNDFSVQHQQEGSAAESKIESNGNLQSAAHVPEETKAGVNKQTLTSHHQASTNKDIWTALTHCEAHSLVDNKVSNAPANTRTVVITLTRVEDLSAESCVDAEKIQLRDEIAVGKAASNGSSKESDSFLEVHPSTTSQKNQMKHSETVGEISEGSDLCDTEDLDKKTNSESELPPPSVVIKVHTEEEVNKENKEETMLDTDSSSTEKTTTDQTPKAVKEKPVQLSSLFSGLLSPKKEAVEEDDTPEEPQSPAKKRLFTDQSNKKEVKGDFLEQLTQFLNKGEGKRKQESMTSPPLSPISQELAENTETSVEEPAVPQSEETNKSTNAETALGALKAFFTVKSAKKDAPNRMDLDSVKKKINRDKDVLKAFFDRSSSKSPDNKETPVSK